MKKTKTINVRKSINDMAVGESILLPKSKCKISSVRSIAASITMDSLEKIKFNVNATADVKYITVTRIS